ncbi:hypothetical protein K431DRAFT_289820 [Polychaeton citri CBS 116435]|uniref:F-box domain-containing protein n=1 Tax=Polychaeton citri CBS 116435 TaxID=1314669 RepID=A0A9P4PY48_9PEZI|nr:hypothetical protein K431DRAFT_289820 [Polychaeton citri CBS 116435]
MTGFLDLPSEIIAHVFTCLDRSSLYNGRAACKDIRGATFSLFGRRHFQKRGYLLCDHSLRVLENIASHPQLRVYPRHVWFNPDLYTFIQPHYVEQQEDGDFGGQETIGTSHHDMRLHTFRRVVAEHKQLLHSDALTVRLAAIFSKLSNLKVVGMRRSTGYSACGWQRLEIIIGIDPRILGPVPEGPPDALSGPTMLYVAILNAARSSRLKLQRLYTDAVELDCVNHLTLPNDSPSYVCEKLRWLEVNLVKGHLTTKTHAEHTVSDEQQLWGQGLETILSASHRSLHGLDLMVFPDRAQSHMLPPRWNQVESWRRSYPYVVLQRIAKTIQLTSLRRLKLEKLTTSSETLLQLLRPCQQSLQSLKIRDVRLLTGTDTEGNQEARPWGTVFAFLAASCPSLSFVLFHLLRHGSGGVTFERNDPDTESKDAPEPDGAIPVAVYGGPAGGEVFTSFDHITLQIQGLQEVKQRLDKIVETHFYGGSVFSYAMDEDLWHTDTSNAED